MLNLYRFANIFKRRPCMISCAVTTSFLGCLVTMFLFIRYVWFLGLSPLANAAALVALLLIGCFPLLVSYRFENALGSLYPCYRYGLYYVFISAIILLTLTLVTDAVWFAGYKFGWFDCLPYSREFCIKYNLWLVGAAALFGAYALYAGTKIPDFKEITLSSPQINRKRTIVVLSDLHIHRVINPEKIKGIVAKTNAQNPDIILLAGDVIDDNVKSISSTISLLKGLKAKEGIYFVTGNHEFYAGYKPTVETLKKLGFTFLENGGVSLEDIYIAGIPDTFSGHFYGKNADLEKNFAESGNNRYRILLSHTPTDFGRQNNFNLEISGHTHGGQILPFHILTLLHNKYLAGLYKMENNAHIYVTRGAGQWGPQMRFLAPSEITVIKLTPSKGNN